MIAKGFNKIFCLGEGKTGTTSLNKAFLDLGLKSIHHGSPESKNFRELKENARLINNQINECQKQGRKLLTHISDYDAYSDIWAIRQNFEILDRQYPNSKFIYTDRSLEKWLDSMRRHVERNVINVANNLYETKLTTIEEEKWITNKNELFRRIKEYFADRPEDLLIIDITKGDGYEKICPFLNLNIPKNSFPQNNIGSEEDKKVFQNTVPIILSNHHNLSVEKYIQDNFLELQEKKQYDKIAELISNGFQTNSQESNLKIFGYIPRIFRTVEISNHEQIDRVISFWMVE
jgi:hypothetical protein